ncbi:reverse transcriptase [Tanacetum coccineum]
MLVLSWNCQGIGRPLTVSNLRALHKAHCPDVVFLIETKNKQRMLEKIRRSLKFSDAYYIDPVGRSGGLALWWNSATGLNILNGRKNLITAEGIFSMGVYSYSGFMCFVYAPHDAASRSPVWNAIIQTTRNMGTTDGIFSGDICRWGKVVKIGPTWHQFS